MNRFFVIVCFLLINLLLTACKKSNTSYEYELNKSFTAWLDFKKSSNNNYQYEVAFQSWAGSKSTTLITVKDGQVVQRSFKLIHSSPNPNIPSQIEWIENSNELNTHPESGAAETLTIDQVYEKARTEWLTKRENAKIYFRAENNGLISSCGYVPDGCMDDCFRGIRISYIKPL